MKIAEVLARVAKGETLGDEEKQFLAGYEEPDVESVLKARLAREKAKHDKELGALKAQLDELGEKAAGGDDVQKQLDRLNQKLQAQSELREAAEKALAQTKREFALRSVKVPWLDGVNAAYRDTVIKTAFEGVETDELGNEAVVGPVIKRIVAENKEFMAAATPTGAGTTAGSRGTAAPEDGKTYKIPDWRGMDPKQVRKEVEKMWKAETVVNG